MLLLNSNIVNVNVSFVVVFVYNVDFVDSVAVESLIIVLIVIGVVLLILLFF